MKYLTTFCFCMMLLFSCNTDRTAENTLLADVSKYFNEKNLVFYNKVVQLKNIRLEYPVFHHKKFDHLMRQLIKHDTIGVFCTEQEALSIQYEVQHFSNHLVCVMKDVQVKCPMGNKLFHLSDPYTFLLKDEKVNEVKFTTHAELKKNLKARLEAHALNLCTEPNLDQLIIYIRKGKPMIKISYASPLCDTSFQVPFKANTIKVKELKEMKW